MFKCKSKTVFNSPGNVKTSVSQHSDKNISKYNRKSDKEKTKNQTTLLMCNNEPLSNSDIDQLFQVLSIEDFIDSDKRNMDMLTCFYRQCRFCGSEEESVEHIISKCPILAPLEYRGRHDKVARAIHWCLCSSHGIAVNVDWRKHVVSDVTETAHVKIFWDYGMLTKKRVVHNRPDLVLVDRRRGRVFIVEVAVSRDHLVGPKERFKKEKYEALAKEMKDMWNLEVTVLPVIVGAYGNMREHTRRSLEQLEISCDPLFLQKIAFSETIVILGKIIQQSSGSQ